MAVPLVYLDPYYSKIVNEIGDKILEKTRVFNPSANVWRFLRPEDLGLTAVESGGSYKFAVAPGVTTIISVKINPGLGVGIIGVICDSDFGSGAAMIVKVNTVKRAEYPLAPVYNSQYKFGIFPDQVAYAKQNDRLEVVVANTSGSTVTGTIFPIGIVAGEAKTLLVAE